MTNQNISFEISGRRLYTLHARCVLGAHAPSGGKSSCIAVYLHCGRCVGGTLRTPKTFSVFFTRLGSSVVQALGPAGLLVLSAAVLPTGLQPGHELCQQGSPGDRVWFLTEGAAHPSDSRVRWKN